MTTTGLRAGLVNLMIAARAAESPDTTAVTDGTTSMTYRQLLDLATQIAHEVRSAGGGRGHIVGLSYDRSIHGVAAMLGILYSGAGWLYLPEDWPQARLVHMLAECRVDLMVTAHGTPHGWPPHASVCVEDIVAAVPLSVPPVRDTTVGTDDCYVIYTSGSTGVPKGVAVSHAGIANAAHQLADAYGVAPGARMLQFASWTWDAAVAEILVPLSAGATVVLAPDDTRRDGAELAALMRHMRVSVATLTPSVIAALPDHSLPDLRTIVSVGEPCPPELVRRWAVDGRRFLNGYGPTETSVAVSVGECRPGEEVTIGRPLPGVTVSVTDDSGRAVQTGEQGRLLIGGIQVARYLGEPFTDAGDDPFVVDEDGQRWFRSGDLVRTRDDGALVHLGRVDDQAKIRGQRVHLAEVEATIGRLPHVQACAVQVSGGRLVAHVLADKSHVDVDAITREAAEWLPDFMVPAAVHVVDDWPLTPNGKLDRRVLTSTTLTELDGPGPSTNGVLADVLRLLCRELEIPDVGPHDNFFDLGVGSLLEVQLAMQLSKSLGVNVTPQQVIAHPTAAQLASLVDQLRVSAAP